MPNFGDYEEKFLENIDGATRKVVSQLNIESLTKSSGVSDSNDRGGQVMTRVRNDGISGPINHEPLKPDLYGINNNAASSFVMIVLGVIVLVGLLSFVTFLILNSIGV